MSLQSDAKKALKLFNSGAWLQLEGSIGRWVNSFVEGGYFVKDEEKTKRLGPVKFVDGYGRPQQQYWAKINWAKVHENEWGYNG